MSISQEYIKSRSEIRQGSDCWHWTGKSANGTCGQVNNHGKSYPSHYASWAAFYGPIPWEKKVICKCGNTFCVNPEHLELKDIVARCVDNLEYIKENSTEDTTTGCLIWNGKKNASGYGRCASWKENIMVHRKSWEVNNGPIPEGYVVCHACDTPACVNPEHLFLGTQSDNHADMVEKGRNVRGAAHTLAKLTDEKVNAIRRDCRASQVIAEEYGVSRALINGIRKGTRWKHVPA